MSGPVGGAIGFSADKFAPFDTLDMTCLQPATSDISQAIFPTLEKALLVDDVSLAGPGVDPDKMALFVVRPQSMLKSFGHTSPDDEKSGRPTYVNSIVQSLQMIDDMVKFVALFGVNRDECEKVFRPRLPSISHDVFTSTAKSICLRVYKSKMQKINIDESRLPNCDALCVFSQKDRVVHLFIDIDRMSTSDARYIPWLLAYRALAKELNTEYGKSLDRLVVTLYSSVCKTAISKNVVVPANDASCIVPNDAFTADSLLTELKYGFDPVAGFLPMLFASSVIPGTDAPYWFVLQIAFPLGSSSR